MKALPFPRALAWFILSIFLSHISDVMAKYLGDDLHHSQITFMRFGISLVLLLPFCRQHHLLRMTSHEWSVHLLRGGLLFLGTLIWFQGLAYVPLASATAIGFSIPFYTFLLAALLLGERLDRTRSTMTLIGFLGVCVILQPTGSDFEWRSLILVVATFLYALLDVLNKKFSTRLAPLNMLFYSSLFGSLFSVLPAVMHWSTPSAFQLLLLTALGTTANLILYCMLRAFRLCAASALTPFRYVELILSVFFGWLVFGETPPLQTYIGAATILGSMLALSYFETRSAKIPEETTATA
jgi:S-adenosylmethionine uptake transporter